MGCAGSSNTGAVLAPVPVPQQTVNRPTNQSTPAQIATPSAQVKIAPKDEKAPPKQPPNKLEQDDPKKSISPATNPILRKEHQPTPVPPQTFVVHPNSTSRSNLKTTRGQPDKQQQPSSISPSTGQSLTFTGSYLSSEDKKKITSKVRSVTLIKATPKEWNEQLMSIYNNTDRNLTQLRLIDSPGADVYMPMIAKIASLRSLQLVSAQVSYRALPSLLSMTSLEVLKIDETVIQKKHKAPEFTVDFFKQVLLKLENLKVLIIPFPEVFELNFSGSTTKQKLADKHCLFIASSTKNLKKLDISNNNIKGDGIIQLAGLKNLQELDISNNQLNDEGASQLPLLTSLKILNVTGNHISASTVVHLSKQLPNTVIKS